MSSIHASSSKHTYKTTPSSSIPGSGPSDTGLELMTHLHYAVDYLQKKHPHWVELADLLSYLSLPRDAQRNIPLLEQALQGHPRVKCISGSQIQPGNGPYRYCPRHPVTNSDELLNYLTRRDDAMGVSVMELKDGWPDCIPVLERLESEGRVLLLRDKHNSNPSMVWPDLPTYHLLHSNLSDSDARVTTRKVDSDILGLWHNIKIPADIDELRNELEHAGMLPTSVAKDSLISSVKIKERKPTLRAGSKMTNHHMLGILKDYRHKH